MKLPDTKAWTGSRMIDVLNPDPKDILLTEIAVGLSREPRYGGAATAIPWSVAQHCLLAERYAIEDGVESPDIRAVILLHDAPEYMLRDLISPVKRFCPDYRKIESVWWRAVAKRFKLPYEMPGIVKHYDMLACSSEKEALISKDAGAWPDMPPARPLPVDLLTMRQGAVGAAFESRVMAALKQSVFQPEIDEAGLRSVT